MKNCRVGFLIMHRLLTILWKMIILISNIIEWWKLKIIHSNTHQIITQLFNKTSIRWWVFSGNIWIRWFDNWRLNPKNIYASSGKKYEQSSQSDMWLWDIYICICDTVWIETMAREQGKEKSLNNFLEIYIQDDLVGG